MKKSTFIIVILLTIAINLLMNHQCSISKNKQNHSKSIKEKELLQESETENFYSKKNKEIANHSVSISRSNSITAAVSKIELAVVSINVMKTQIVRRNTNPFQNPFFGFFDVPHKRSVQSIGSGVIFDQDGYILTNSHVVEGATQIKVILTDGKDCNAELIGFDKIHDVAVLKINGENLPVAKLGNSDDLIIGEWSIAIGNPYGFLIKDSKPSVSVGVISAINRNFAEDKEGKIYKKMIQTDTAINPGNSGGPLVNVLGEVVGINTFIFSDSGGSIGLGFSIPINRVKKIADELIKFGKIRKPWFGFKVQDINPMIASYLNLKSLDGVIVAFVEPNSPAENAEIKRGDLIININGNEIKNSDDAELAVSDISIGENINLIVKRGKKEKKISILAKEH